MAEIQTDIENEFLKLARVALAGRTQDIQLLIYKISKKYKQSFPKMTDELVTLLQESPTRSSPLRKQSDVPLPVDIDSRLQLLRIEEKPLDHEPVLSQNIKENIDQILSERRNTKALMKLGLQPSKSVLFTGPPGVGKTMIAKWIAEQLNRPLVVLDLAAVMSSYLGRTGNNIRFVLDYAKSIDCVLLLDELDAIAKRRDDQSEIGELKRLVTVLLQEIDDWPSSGLLIAATNHPDLLDPAVWRRFEMILKFEMPVQEQIQQFVSSLLEPYTDDHDKWSHILSYVYSGKSYSYIEKNILYLRKVNAMHNKPLGELIEQEIRQGMQLTRDEKVELACSLMDAGLTQRRVNELTGIARETMRKKAQTVIEKKIVQPVKTKKAVKRVSKNK